jgi:hypothetical protein
LPSRLRSRADFSNAPSACAIVGIKTTFGITNHAALAIVAQASPPSSPPPLHAGRDQG